MGTKLKLMSEDLGISERVVFKEQVSEDELITFYQSADLFIFPTRLDTEGFGLVAIEAMACGCPVIATDCPTGPREILGHNKYGLLVPVDDPEALARSVEELLADESRRTYFQAQAKLRAQDFELEHIGSKYVRLLQTIAETRA
jgi:glycosyltransferase involved in cell wall biosynthesis